MPSIKDAYLVVYNVACACGWGFVLLACIRHIMEGRNEPEALYSEVEQVLQVVQTAALMEVGRLPCTRYWACAVCQLFCSLCKVSSKASVAIPCLIHRIWAAKLFVHPLYCWTSSSCMIQSNVPTGWYTEYSSIYLPLLLLLWYAMYKRTTDGVQQ